MSGNNSFSRLGFILATAGSAIGLGNIWRFPYLMANHGGGTFVILYLFFVFTIGLFLMIAEFTIGKYLGDPVTDNIKVKIKYSKFFYFSSYLFPIIGMVILSYYFVVSGWTLYYFAASLFGGIDYSSSVATADYFGGIFGGLLGNPTLLVSLTALFVLITAVINYRGVKEGIEAVSNIFLPLLFVLIVLLIIRVLFLDGAIQGLKYFITFELSTVTPSTVVAALGQAFFSLSLGMGVLMVYSSYADKDTSIISSARATVLLDTAVALCASALIIPIVFAFGYDLNAGPGLTFITLPTVFSHVAFGFILASMFFFVMAIASLTSTISLLEVTLPFAQKLLNIERKPAVVVMSILLLIAATLQALSFNVLANITFFGFPMFDFFADVFTNVLFLFSVCIVCFMLTFGMVKEDVKKVLTNDGKMPFKRFNAWYCSVKYVVPVVSLGAILSALIAVIA